MKKTTNEWMTELAPEQFEILRNKGTERPGTGEYNKFYPKEGHFACAGCGQALYSAQSKFYSGCGWPAFDKIVEGAVVTETDSSLGMVRVEIMCSNCGGHLGHVFEGEGFTPVRRFSNAVQPGHLTGLRTVVPRRSFRVPQVHVHSRRPRQSRTFAVRARRLCRAGWVTRRPWARALPTATSSRRRF